MLDRGVEFGEVVDLEDFVIPNDVEKNVLLGRISGGMRRHRGVLYIENGSASIRKKQLDNGIVD